MKFLWLTLALLGTAFSPHAESCDIILRNGRVIDGSGNPARFVDIAIEKGRIAAIGKIKEHAAQELDVRGMIIAPGFIDVHTHAENILEEPRAENFVRMGVTTLVLGNCGGSALNVGEYFKQLERTKVSANVATLIGHGTVRSKAMGGSFMRPPTDEEMHQMKTFVEKAMQDGAVGMSTGLIYLPGTFAKTEEIIELAKVVSDYDGIYTTHQRSEGEGIFKSLDEIFRIAREAHIPAEISHLKLSGKSNWGQTDKVLAAIADARAEGLDITQDQYAYTASSTGISQLIPDSAREGKKFNERIADPAQKTKIIAELKAGLKRRGNDDYSYAVIASYKKDKSFNGLNIVEAAKKSRGNNSLDDQIETIFEIEKNGGAQGVFHSMEEDDVRAFMRHPNTMIASDSGIRAFNVGVPHPRGYGDNARVLGRYVRDEKVLALEDAIRKMTSLPAKTFRLQNRGELLEGNWADIVVFDPATVIDNATYKNPHQYSTGFKYVFVNGVAVVENDQHTDKRPGMALRHVMDH